MTHRDTRERPGSAQFPGAVSYPQEIVDIPQELLRRGHRFRPVNAVTHPLVGHRHTRNPEGRCRSNETFSLAPSPSDCSRWDATTTATRPAIPAMARPTRPPPPTPRRC